MAGHTSTADALDAMRAARAARYWWLVLLGGIAWLVIAWQVLRMDVRSLVAVGVLMGVLFLGAAADEAALASTVRGGWKILHYVTALGFALAAGWAFIRPINTFFALASVLGLVLLVMGAFDLMRAVASRRENPLWWMGLISGVLLLLALWVSSSDREFALGARAVLLLLWVGFMTLFRGISHITLAFALRPLEQAPPPPAAVAGQAQPIPPQERRSEQPPVRPLPTA
jgi:uncharacterized membrane protein HdeD (DUF308 family)